MESDFTSTYSRWMRGINILDEDYSEKMAIAIRAASMFFGETEEWVSVKGWKGVYSVSNFGRIYSHERIEVRGNGRRMVVRNRILRICSDGYGYARIVMRGGGNVQSIRVHRLVALNFIENKSNKPQINHKDFVRHNNHISNLEWCTHKENMQHASRKEGRIYAKPALGMTGKLNYKSKPVLMLDDNMGIISKYENARDADRDGITHANHIYDVCIGKRKTAGGYRWMYAEEYHKRNK